MSTLKDSLWRSRRNRCWYRVNDRTDQEISHYIESRIVYVTEMFFGVGSRGVTDSVYKSLLQELRDG